MAWYEAIPAAIRAHALQTLVVLAAAFVLWKFIVRAGDHYVQRTHREEGVDAAERAQRLGTLWQGVRRVLLIVVLVVVVLTVLAIW
jgi:small-conductance mechanosensitive channel